LTPPSKRFGSVQVSEGRSFGLQQKKVPNLISIGLLKPFVDNELLGHAGRKTRWVFELDDIPEHEPGHAAGSSGSRPGRTRKALPSKRLLVTGKVGKQRILLELASLSAIRLRKRKISPC
jgi:hypothetical protein